MSGLPSPPAPASVVRITNRSEAESFVAKVLDGLAALVSVLEHETGHVRQGRIREGLSEETRKAELTASYLRALEAVKANAIALARFAPDALERLKAAHASFGRVVEENQIVLATARAVSESLVKTIAEELNRSTRPQVYAPPGYGGGRAGHAARTAAEPVLMSRRL